MVRKYKKVPVVIDAIQYTGDEENVKEVQKFLEDGNWKYEVKGEVVIVQTLEGDHNLVKGNYLIRGIKGEYYPCRKDIFEKTYQLVS